jgi:3-deoxy-D-manno-octulosonate 8-phosphate phosphatase (KDO 8-P phosphatase)
MQKTGIMKKQITDKLKKIKVLLLDVDGVLTDGSIIYTSDGAELKIFNTHDGYGITKAIASGIRVGIITGRQSEPVGRRAKELGIVDLYQGSVDKMTPYEKIKKKYNLQDEEVAYVGDDMFDISLLSRVGFSAAPSSARREVKRVVTYITKASGGNGSVREVIDLILSAR